MKPEQFIKKRGVVFGVGINDVEGVSTNPKLNKVYGLWVDMLERCFSERRKSRGEAYQDTTCSEDWRVFSNFLNDISSIPNSKMIYEGWHMDKDLLVAGNKVYSKETVSFVPRQINNLLVLKFHKQSGLPQGVSKKKTRYIAQISIEGEQTYIGSFGSIKEAYNAYKKAKENYVKSVANKWKGQIDQRIYDYLISYELPDHESIYGGGHES